MRLLGEGNIDCIPAPTMYDPFVFCDRCGGRKKNIYLMETDFNRSVSFTRCLKLLLDTEYTKWSGCPKVFVVYSK